MKTMNYEIKSKKNTEITKMIRMVRKEFSPHLRREDVEKTSYGFRISLNNLSSTIESTLIDFLIDWEIKFKFEEEEVLDEDDPKYKKSFYYLRCVF